MKRIVPALLPVLLVALGACSSSGSGKASATAPAPEPTAPALTAEQEKAQLDAIRLLSGLPPASPEEAPRTIEDWPIVEDEATGRRLQKIPKSASLRVVDGKLRHAQLNPKMFELDLVREDAGFYYVEAPVQAPRVVGDIPPDDLKPLATVDPLEFEEVAPRTSKVRLRFEEKSEGLPTSGFWRSNMTVADLDGDGSPEIVAPPPRLAATMFQIFRFDGARWQPVAPDVRAAEEGIGMSFGGVDVADMDGDGRPDVLAIGHGDGPTVAYNEGGFRFRHEARGLPRKMRGRGIAAGDLDGDKVPDILAISDEPEGVEERQNREREAQRLPAKGPDAPAADGGTEDYRRGFDMRAFFGRTGGPFAESTAGLERACYGYALALVTRPVDGRDPFFVSGCRYIGWKTLLYEWSAATRDFRYVGRGVVESYSLHLGAAAGTYRGFPAGFVSYSKLNAPVALDRPMRGQGVSVYYRDGEGWKRKRVVKTLSESPRGSDGLGVGDLDGDGLDDVVWADNTVGRLRVFFQTRTGEYEELDPDLQPRFVNDSTSVKVADVDRDGRNDLVLMYQFQSSSPTRAGGLRFFRNAG